jgi:hypothetical protein
VQFTARHTARSLKEARHLSRRFSRRALRAATNARAIIYFAGGVWVGVGLIVRSLHTSPARPQERMQQMLAGGFVLLLIAAILLFGHWRQNAKLQKALRGRPDEQIRCDDAGIAVTLPTGETAFEPWTDFVSFREGKSIVLLTRPKAAPARTIPINTLNPTQTGELRSLLLNHLPHRR